MPQLTIASLPLDRLGEAYPLVRAVARVSLERWQAFGRRLAAEEGGLLAAFAGEGRLHGVAAWRRAEGLRHEDSLAVELIAAFELGRAGVVRKALADALDDVARSRGCRSLVYTVAASRDDVARHEAGWGNLGLELETISLVRRIGEACADQTRK